MKKGMFVTIFYVILDSKNRIISYASAGHNPMVLFRAETDETFFLNPRGFPVGISLPDDTLFRRSIDVEKIKLKKDDMLVIYTDGVTEAMNEDREQYGEDRLIKLIKENGRKTPDEFIDSLNEDIRVFTGGYPQNDDITVVAVKEKLMADDVLYGIRKKLMDLVDIEGLSVAEACTRMKVSPSTYYRYRKRLTEMGERGLKNKTLRQEHEIRRVSNEQRKGLLSIIRENPRFGAKRIAVMYNEDKGERDSLSPSLVYDELKRMRLNTYEKRLEYLRRNRLIDEEEYQKLLSGKGVEKPAEAVPGPAAVESAAGVDPGEVSGPVETGPAEEEETRALEEAVDGVLEEAASLEEALRPQDETPDMAPITISRYRDEGPQEIDNIDKILSEVMAGAGSGGKILSVIPEELEGGVIVLRVKGHLDSSSTADLENILENVFTYGFRKIIVDLADVSYISSGGWGIFTGRVKELRDGGGDVVLAGMSPEVFDIYELLGFQDIIMHCQTIDEALEYISMPFEERQSRLA
ncbi:MAG TPA: anti-sigma factor antagonist, partial [Candidatus Krumholzibacterium sp.]|nr:anti-sigma factor antagonist [Candidatus Krumholzibacterium sp.]